MFPRRNFVLAVGAVICERYCSSLPACSRMHHHRHAPVQDSKQPFHFASTRYGNSSYASLVIDASSGTCIFVLRTYVRA
jgi:hypothetical protein